jgi:penicillin-binding protein 1A
MSATGSAPPAVPPRVRPQARPAPPLNPPLSRHRLACRETRAPALGEPRGIDGTRVGKRRNTSAEGAAALDVRLTPDDRTTAPAEGRRRKAEARQERGEASEEAESDERRPRRAARTPAPAPGKSKASGGGRDMKRKRFGLGRLVYWGAVLGIWAVIAVAGVFGWVALHLPPIQSLEIPKRPPTIQINAGDGRIFATRGEMGGTAIAIRDMPAHLPNAFIAIEDRRFYHHHGIDPIGLIRAVLANVLHRGISQGGSTITQQLAKNLFLTPERHLMRKLQEVVLALWLEHKFTKAEILELYLNRVYFGSGAYGVEAAAQRYFGKTARHVTLGEAALLAGLVKSPSRLAPTKNYDAAERRAQIVLAAMSDARLIKEEAAKAAIAFAPAVVKPSAGGSSNYVADWVMDVLNDLVGRVEEDIIVDTTIDAELQAAAEKALLDQLTQKGERFGVEQGALVAMTPDGAVRALVGGRNYQENQFNRAVAAKRQPGSTFKPFVYLTALERGLTPDSVRDDRPVELKGWRPENFNREYAGPVTLTQALANSRNSVSVRLTMEFGPTAVVRTAHRLGIASKLEPNASIALGTSEVSVLEIVSAYAPFANGGLAVIPRAVERVRTTRGGKTLFTRNQNTLGRVVDARYVGMMNAMMREVVASGTARRAALPGWTVAGKTGTSQDFRDAWFIGYTSQLVTGVWLGNDDNTPTKKITGGGLPVEVWSQFMRAAHRGKPPSDVPGAIAGIIAGFAPQPGATMTGAPIPPASVAGGRGAPVRPEEGSIDGWFLDRLFSRR